MFRTIAFVTAYVGITIKIAKNPPIFPAAKMSVMTVKGCIANDFPIIFGVMTLLSVCWAMSVTSATQKTSDGSCNNPTMSAGMNAIHGPINGIKFIKSANNANNNAYSNPIKR